MAFLDTARDALVTALDAITDLEPYARVKGQINTPAAIVAPDSITYDMTFDGSADYRIPVQFLVGLGDWESAQVVLDGMVAHDGTAVAAINNMTSIEARVVELTEYGLTRYADKDFLGAVLVVSILA